MRIDRYMITGNRDVDCKLGVTEDREHGGDARDDVRDDYGRAGDRPGLLAREHKDAGADDGADTEPDDVPPGQSLLHVVTAPLPHLVQLHLVKRSSQQPVLDPGDHLPQCPPVVGPALERFLRQKITLAASPALLLIHDIHLLLLIPYYTTTSTVASSRSHFFFLLKIKGKLNKFRMAE